MRTHTADDVVRAAFARRFDRAPVHVARAPGRLELLGNHTDYNDGLVLAVAVDRELAIAVAPRGDRLVRIVSLALNEEVSLDPRGASPAAVPLWARYVVGVLAQLVTRGVTVPGFDALVTSDLPPGAGLSSSAALEVATALAVRGLAPYRLSPGGSHVLDDAERWALAALCRAAEREFVGVPCGLLDQVAVLFGRTEAALLLDCRAPSVQTVPLRDAALVVCDSGERHELADSGYAAIVDACRTAATTLRLPSLRDADLQGLAAAKRKLPARARDCARHVVEENARVATAATALGAGDLATVGRCMTESHASSRRLLRNSTPVLDELVRLALDCGALGARLTGGGFGGSTVSLVAADAAPAFLLALAERTRAAGLHIAPRRFLPAAGAA
jgi:galactokinase